MKFAERLLLMLSKGVCKSLHSTGGRNHLTQLGLRLFNLVL